MADTIPGKQVIEIGLQNESIGSDSLYTAFNKTKTNFNTLFACASPYNTFNSGEGITATANANTGTVDFTNTGVLNIIPADSSIVINQSNGNVQIRAVGGGGGGGGLTSVGIIPASTARLTVSNSPIISNGNMTLDLAVTGVAPGSYTNPTVTVDSYGRVMSIASAASPGTVSSISISPGSGIQVVGSPITTSGTITITNTGVTKLTAGSGISLSGSNGNVTISAPVTGGTVTSVGISSSSLTVTNSPITTTGTISVDLPTNVSVTGSTTIGTFMKLTPGTAPSSPTRGTVYYDSTANKLKVYTGSAWETITSA